MMANLTHEQTVLELIVFVEFSSPKDIERFVNRNSPESQEFERLLLRYLTDFVVAMGLPSLIRLEICQVESTFPILKPKINVRLGDRPFRLPIRRIEPEEKTPDYLARFVSRAVAEDRETLISEELVEAVWPLVSQRGGETTDTLKTMQGLKCLREFLRQGYALSKLPILLQRCSGSSSGTKPTTSFVEALFSPDFVGVDVALGPDQIEAICCVTGQANNQNYDYVKALNPRFEKLRLRLFDELGVILPKIKVRSDAGLGRNDFRIRLNDMLLPPEDGVQKAEVLVDDAVDRLLLIDVRGRSGLGETMKEKTIVDSKDQASCRNAGLNVWNSADWVVHRIELAIRERAEMFLTTYCIDNLHASSPHLVEAVRQRIGLPMLLRVLECLLEEGLSIRDLQGICESLLAVDSTTTVDQSKFIVFFPPISNLCPVNKEKPFEELENIDYLNCVRMAMKLYISRKYARGGTLKVYLLDRQIEERLLRAEVEPLTEDELHQLLLAIDRDIGEAFPSSTPTTLLTTMEVRRKLWTLIEREFRRFPVLTYGELSPDLNIQPIARISWD